MRLRGRVLAMVQARRVDTGVRVATGATGDRVVRQPSPLARVIPFLEKADAELADHHVKLEQQDRKLGEHDRAFAKYDQELVTLRHLLQVQIGAIDETLRRIRLGMNGH